MSDEELCFAQASELVSLYRRRKVSPLEVVKVMLARIEKVNPALNAYCTVATEQALAAARRATAVLGKKGAKLGALHGVPVSIKDLTPTKGIRTTWGSKIYEHHVPDEDALVVERLKAAGAIVLGKTNTPEFGAGANTFNAVFGATRNPWNPNLTCGGSTGGGAVALATGLGPLAQGSDLGGSLRLPASFCGVVGFRTSPGCVPVWPVATAWDSLSVQGPMARTVADTALMLSTLVGPDPRVPISYPVDARALLAAVRTPSVKGLRIAWGGDLGITPLDHEVRRITEATLDVFRKLGARVEAAHPDFGEVGEIVRTSRGASMAARHHDKLAQWKPVMQENLVRNIEQGLALTPIEIGQGERLRTDLFHRVRAFMERYDLILTPTAAVPPFPVEMTSGPREINGVPMQHYIQWALLTYAFTVVNAPAISIPCGFTRDGLPVGLQIAGRWRDEIGVLRAAAAFEKAAPWAHLRPPVAGSTRNHARA
jgi:amidase